MQIVWEHPFLQKISWSMLPHSSEHQDATNLGVFDLCHFDLLKWGCANVALELAEESSRGKAWKVVQSRGESRKVRGRRAKSRKFPHEMGFRAQGSFAGFDSHAICHLRTVLWQAHRN